MFIAADWGTTNRRLFLIEDGVVRREEQDGRGASALAAADYPAEVAGIRARLGDLPMLLAGMVGSTIGWRAVPYLPTPCGLDGIAGALHAMDTRTAIVPGLSHDDPPDVMRGEEVQLLGAHAAGLVPDDALLCQPGTHCKWARLEGGRVAAFSTAMTGELFALVRAHSILAAATAGPVEDGSAFRAGVTDGAARGIATGLFGVRARALLHGKEDGAAFASGVLIGADVARHGRAGPIHILADDRLGRLYAAAVAETGGTAHLVSSRTAFLAGIVRLRELSA
jgi:2-dehydro-3-deoxygalactonokinase